MDQQPAPNFIKTSPARDALSELLDLPTMSTVPIMATVNEESNSDLLSTGDANSLIVDLNDLLKRDPTLSSLSEDTLAVDVNVDSTFGFMSSSLSPNTLPSVNNAVPLQNVANVIQGVGVTSMEIPSVKTTLSNLMVPNNSPATWTHMISGPLPPNSTVIKSELSPNDQATFFNELSPGSHPNAGHATSFQPTLAQLNSPTGPSDTIKIESVDLDMDDIGQFFMKNNSPNVTLGVGPANRSSLANSTSPTINVGGITIRGQLPKQPQQTTTAIWPNGPEDSSFTGTNNPWSNLSSSMPTGAMPIIGSGGQGSISGVTASSSYNISPLSDILTDLSSNSGSTPNQSLSPNLPSNSPSQAGPTRSSTLHKLLMRKDQAKQTGRPSPVRSPDGSIIRPNKTLEVIRNSLSSSSTLLSQQQMSTSAPVNHSYMSEAAAAASGSGYPRVWARREPRPHISSVCSVGETSTLADEVNEVLGRMDPNDLQDIVSDDEDNDEDGSQTAHLDGATSDGKNSQCLC